MEKLEPDPPDRDLSLLRLSQSNRVKLSSINIRLWDTSRTVEISGRSRDHVEAAASVASTILSQAETIVGGLAHRAFGAFFLLAETA